MQERKPDHRRRKRRRRHGNGLLRIQGWHRDGFAQVAEKLGGYTVGVLVQCNCGRRDLLRIAGAPVGYEIPGKPAWGDDTGSIIVVVATDAPLLPGR